MIWGSMIWYYSILAEKQNNMIAIECKLTYVYNDTYLYICQWYIYIYLSMCMYGALRLELMMCSSLQETTGEATMKHR